jgi:hypothetical protein
VTTQPQRAFERAFTAAGWLGLALAAAISAAALWFHWCVDAESLGARDAGMALACSMYGAVLLMGGLYAAPSFAVLALVGFTVARRAGFVFLAAALIAALPFAVLR